VRLWRKSDDPGVRKLVVGLARKLGREPTAKECRQAALETKVKLGGGVTDVRLHDLRHAFASIAAASGMGLPIIGKILGHSQAATTARYAHLASDPVKAAAAVVSAQIAGAMNAGANTSKAARRNND